MEHQIQHQPQLKWKLCVNVLTYPLIKVPFRIYAYLAYIGLSIQILIDWLICQNIYWLIWLIRLICQYIEWSIDFSIYLSINLPIYWLIDWSISWLICQYIDKLIGLIDWFVNKLIDLSIYWLIDRSVCQDTDWLIDLSIDVLMYWLVKSSVCPSHRLTISNLE